MDNKMDDYRDRRKNIYSVYQSHYEKASNKFGAVQEFISIKNEVLQQNEKTAESIRGELNRLSLIHEKGGDWIEDNKGEWVDLIINVFRDALLGFKTNKDDQNHIVKLTESLGHTDLTIKTVKITLLGCSTLADNKLRENQLELLIRVIMENNYPVSLQNANSEGYSGNNGSIEIDGPHYSIVENIIHRMAVKRSGPDKRSSYKYDDVFNALKKKYNNPELRYKDLNTSIGESTFSTMWSQLTKSVKEVNTSEID